MYSQIGSYIDYNSYIDYISHTLVYTPLSPSCFVPYTPIAAPLERAAALLFATAATADRSQARCVTHLVALGRGGRGFGGREGGDCLLFMGCLMILMLFAYKDQNRIEMLKYRFTHKNNNDRNPDRRAWPSGVWAWSRSTRSGGNHPSRRLWPAIWRRVQSLRNSCRASGVAGSLDSNHQHIITQYGCVHSDTSNIIQGEDIGKSEGGR